MAGPDILKRVHALLALAADKGATEEERRTAGATAARLIREHGIAVGAPASSPAEGMTGLTSVRVQAVIGGVRSVVEVVSSGLGFDVAAFAQGLLRERLQGAMQDALKTPAPATPRTRARKRKPRATK